MYKLLSQLFLSVVGQNLPEEVFEETLYWLLQGSRKKRQNDNKESLMKKWIISTFFFFSNFGDRPVQL